MRRRTEHALAHGLEAARAVLDQRGRVAARPDRTRRAQGDFELGLDLGGLAIVAVRHGQM